MSAPVHRRIAAFLSIAWIGLVFPPGFEFSLRAAQNEARKSAPDHYLMLVNTAIAFQMSEAKLRQFDLSAYDGLAIAFLHAYDSSEVPPVAKMDAEMKEWKTYTRKDIWPWVYVNRMIGTNLAEKNWHSDTPYFRAIAGADLDDARGAQADFLRLWGNSLASARNSNEPGIVCDLEFYNNYAEYDIGELARRTGKSAVEVAAKLQKLGARMADAAANEYPGAVLWFFFTGFTHPGYKTYDRVAYYPSPTYIAMGLLDEIVQKRLPLKVLTGGEGSIGYCHHTLQDLRSAIGQREVDFKPTLAKYKGTLELAGTMTLWADTKGSENVCKGATAAGVEELQPYLELLFRSYRYNWIWGSADGNYLAFSPQSAPRFDAVIRRARADLSSGTPAKINQ